MVSPYSFYLQYITRKVFEFFFGFFFVVFLVSVAKVINVYAYADESMAMTLDVSLDELGLSS